MSFIFKGISYVFFVNFFFKGLSLIKLKLISFFIARYLTDSLRGPVLTLQNEALCAEFPDGMGWGGTGYQNCRSSIHIYYRNPFKMSEKNKSNSNNPLKFYM